MRPPMESKSTNSWIAMIWVVALCLSATVQKQPVQTELVEKERMTHWNVDLEFVCQRYEWSFKLFCTVLTHAHMHAHTHTGIDKLSPKSHYWQLFNSQGLVLHHPSHKKFSRTSSYLEGPQYIPLHLSHTHTHTDTQQSNNPISSYFAPLYGT